MALPSKLPTNLTVGDPLPGSLNGERTAINALIDEVETRVILPAAPQTGQLMRWDGTAWVTTASRLFEGHGDPNGQFAAPVGSRYVDLDATNGIVEYTKTTGTGNTGWTVSGAQMALKTTGRRNFAGLITVPTGGTVNNAYVQRSGNVVDMYLDLKMPDKVQNPWTLLTALPGFSPGYARYGALQDNSEAAAVGTQVSASGGVYIYATVAGKRDRYSGTWITNDAWPTGAQLPPAV